MAEMDITKTYAQAVLRHSVKTNADRIRAMNAEELADFIARQRFSAVNSIADKLEVDVTMAFISGRKNALDWLQSPADGGDGDG